MVIVYLLSSLIGSVGTAVFLWADSPLLAILVAPIGGSILTALTGVFVAATRTPELPEWERLAPARAYRNKR